MSKELEKYKGTGRSTLGRLAGTLHPLDSASQVSSNILFEEGQEAGGDAAQRIANTKAKQDNQNRSSLSTNSRALVPVGQLSRAESKLSRASSAKSGSGLKIGDISSTVGSSTGDKSSVSTKSKAVIPANRALEAVSESSLSRASASKSSPRPDGSMAGKSFSGPSSSVSKASSAKDSGISKASLAKSSSSPADAVSTGQGSTVSRASHGSHKQPAARQSSSQVSKASSGRSSASAAKDDKSAVSFSGSAVGAKSTVSSTSKSGSLSSQVSKASSSRSNSKSTVSSDSRGSSRASGRSRALLPAGQTAVRASPLRNELRVEDLNDNMYSISIHERGVLQDLPSRDEMLQIILKENPHLDIDEATAIAKNRIATSSAVGRSQVGGSIAPVSMIGRADKSTVSKASSTKSKQIYQPSSSSALSAASTSRRGIEAVKPSSMVSAATARPASGSSISKAPSYYGKEVVQGTIHTPSELSAAPGSYNSSTPGPLTRSNTAPAPMLNFDQLPIANLGGSSLSIFKLPDDSNESAAGDLLAIAQLREQGDIKRAQAMQTLLAQHNSSDSDLARKRLIELEIAKQGLANTQLESQLQEFSIQNAKLGDLQRHAHEDKLAALERAQEAENRRKADSMMDAMRDRTQLEKARHRDRRGDIAKAERDREDERNIRVQKEYERMDHDRSMETIDSFGRLVEASRPRDIPQPRRTNVNLEHSHQYKNPRTGGDGTINMRIHKGCKGKGDGVCSNCGLEFIEHPVKQQSDGSIITRTGKRIMPGQKGNRPDGSAVSNASSSRRQ